MIKGNIDGKNTRAQKCLFTTWARDFECASLVCHQSERSKGVRLVVIKGWGAGDPLGITILGMSRENFNVLP